MPVLSPSFPHTDTLAASLRRWVVGGGWRGRSGTQCVAFHSVAPQVAKQGVEKWAAPVSRRGLITRIPPLSPLLLLVFPLLLCFRSSLLPVFLFLCSLATFSFF